MVGLLWITNVRYGKKELDWSSSVNIGKFKTPTPLLIIQDSYACQLSHLPFSFDKKEGSWHTLSDNS